jgi:hypothetical protein
MNEIRLAFAGFASGSSVVDDLPLLRLYRVCFDLTDGGVGETGGRASVHFCPLPSLSVSTKSTSVESVSSGCSGSVLNSEGNIESRR